MSTASCASAPGRWAPTPSSGSPPTLSDRFSTERRALLDDGGLTGAAFCRAYADLADRWLAGLLGEEPDTALVAVGGYGRRELCPASDLDVVLLHRGRGDVGSLADRVWYPVWDAAIGLDHSVRTVKEAVRVAADDLKAALGLLDVRLVAGDPELAEELAASFCRTDPRIARRFAHVTFTSDNRADLARVRTPTLVLQCTDDVIAPVSVGEYVARTVPDARMVLLDATGHCPNLSAPEETAAAIAEFVGALRSA